MYVRLTTGRNAGQIVEMQYYNATSCLSMGTATAVTEEEIFEAGLAPENAPVSAEPEALPDGYTVEATEWGGFNVLDGNGDIVTPDIEIPNLAAARSFAVEHALSAALALSAQTNDGQSGIVIPDNWRDMHHLSIIALAKKLAPAVASKDEAVIAIEVELAKQA